MSFAEDLNPISADVISLGNTLKLKLDLTTQASFSSYKQAVLESPYFNSEFLSTHVDVMTTSTPTSCVGQDVKVQSVVAESTLTMLGCGTLGTAILSGIFASLASGTETPTSDNDPFRVPSKFIACVRRAASVKRIRQALDEYSQDLRVLENDNVYGVREADVVILGCKPQMVKDILAGNEMRNALHDKVLISICAGVTVAQIENILYHGASFSRQCRVVRAIPNTAAVVRESMTVIATSDPPLPIELDYLVTWIFSRIGRVVHLPATTMDASTALAGSSPAFIALMLQSLADGGVAMGLPRAEAQMMAAQAMRGTADMVLGGEHPTMVSEKVSTPGGCTIGGLLVLEEGRVRGTIARGVREATVVAAQLGKGDKEANRTRPFKNEIDDG